MQRYDLIFLGKSSFTEDLYDHFHSHVNTVIIDNDCIPLKFSSCFFPEISFIPFNNEVDYPYGYIVTNSYRFELNPDINILKIFFSECFRHIDGLGEKLAFEASLYANFLNQLILDNFTKSTFSFIIKNFFKEPKTIWKILKKLDISDKEFNEFINALSIFFAPGECNNQFYSKYLLFSLLTKKLYKAKAHEKKSKQIISKEKLKEIKKNDKGFELTFENLKIEGKFLISTIPPHVLNLSKINNPFSQKADEIFYNIEFSESIAWPSYLPENLIYYDTRDFVYFVLENNKVNLFKKCPINAIPDKEEICKLIKLIFPHIDTLPDYEIKPHIFTAHKIRDTKKLNLNKNYFFTKNIEYPYYGSDGEILYRNIIKETIWKKLL